MTVLKAVSYRKAPESAVLPAGRRRLRWGIGIVVGLAVAGGATVLVMGHQGKADKPAAATAPVLTVTVAPVEMGVMPQSLMVTGSLAAFDDLPIGTETSELALSEVLVDVGDHVRRGQVLARFNDKVLRAQVQQAQAALVEAQANAVEARANARRADELSRTGWMSGKDFDNRRAAAQTADARVQVAEANLALANARLQQAEIKAPSDGTITARDAHLGAVPSGGTAPLFRMIRDDRVELVAELPEIDLAQVTAGQPVMLTVDGRPDSGVTKGVVRLVEPTVDVRTRIGKVRVDVARDAGLKPGMFVTGRIVTGRTETPTVPEKAVVYQDNKPMVFVIDADRRVTPRPIVAGPRDQGRIAVLSGVARGERVAVQGAGYLKYGDLVNIAETPAEATPLNGTN